MLQAISSQLVRDLATHIGMPMDHLEDLSSNRITKSFGAYQYWIGFNNKHRSDNKRRGVKVLFVGTLVSIWAVERNSDVWGAERGIHVRLYDPDSIGLLYEFIEGAVIDD